MSSREALYEKFELSPRQRRFANLLYELNEELSREQDPEPYNDWYRSEAHARFGQWLLHIRRHGLSAPLPPLDAEPQESKHARPRGADLFQRVKRAVRVEEFAARFTTLRTTGPDRMKGLCPIHDEKTASFIVNTDHQTWRCFGACGEGGDVITLAQRIMDKEMRL